MAALDTQSDRGGVSDEARRQLGQIRTALEFRPTPEILADLPQQMLRVQRSVDAAAREITARYFQSGPLPSWTEELV